jgi:hypothetical protein
VARRLASGTDGASERGEAQQPAQPPAAPGPRSAAPPPLEPDPVVEAYKRNVDRTFLRANLACSWEERLRNLIELQRFDQEVRRAARSSSAATATDIAGMLHRLGRAGVELIVVGGVAATAHGGTRLTHDLDLVYGRSRENLARLVGALAPTSPYPRGAPPGLPFCFDVATLERGFDFSLDTSLGEVDLLGALIGGGSYEELVAHAVAGEVFGTSCNFLGLEWLIRVLRAAGRAKDLEVLAELEALREESDPGLRDREG